MLFLITASKDYENKVTDVTLTDVHSVFCSVTRDAPIWHSVSVYFAGLGISQTFLYTMVVTVKLKKKKKLLHSNSNLNPWWTRLRKQLNRCNTIGVACTQYLFSLCFKLFMMEQGLASKKWCYFKVHHSALRMHISIFVPQYNRILLYYDSFLQQYIINHNLVPYLSSQELTS